MRHKKDWDPTTDEINKLCGVWYWAVNNTRCHVSPQELNRYACFNDALTQFTNCGGVLIEPIPAQCLPSDPAPKKEQYQWIKNQIN